eukprot:gnl/TRDRNA2_/TRDRNA2_177440_c0_seq2.p1 gnl/TRDRNA2_/TRDRNA2_177440_c0~~gnl/TRDRNA2_/TRDRNA2_177440_c0_seq2.p1  ORF type:complete len:341 (-),score=-16.78 gnl/TRDRNA2_/TRDRNA2_177440_c0_seq2:42-1064(-)
MPCWVDKYAPKHSNEIIGNKSVIDALFKWLKKWKPNLNKIQSETKISSKFKNISSDKTAVLIRGPPGIGKTTAAVLVSKELGYDHQVVYASEIHNIDDTDKIKGATNKNSSTIKEIVSNKKIDFCVRKMKKILIIDEIDVTASGNNKVMTDIIQTIRISKIPIICIASAKYNPKLKLLRNICLELEFSKPTRWSIIKHISKITHLEGRRIDEKNLGILIQDCDGDIRFILGQLQFTMKGFDSSIVDQNLSFYGYQKNLRLSPFIYIRQLLSQFEKPINLHDRINLVLENPKLASTLVYENYLNYSWEKRNILPNLNSMTNQRVRANIEKIVSKESRIILV